MSARSISLLGMATYHEQLPAEDYTCDVCGGYGVIRIYPPEGYDVSTVHGDCLADLVLGVVQP